MTKRAPTLTLFALLAAFCAAACGNTPTTALDGGPAGPPVRIDGGLRDGGGVVVSDGGGVDRMAECQSYCQKLFACSFLPRPDSPPGFNQATCTSQCTTQSFPPELSRQCVRSAECTCPDAGACHDVASCFPALPGADAGVAADAGPADAGTPDGG